MSARTLVVDVLRSIGATVTPQPPSAASDRPHLAADGLHLDADELDAAAFACRRRAEVQTFDAGRLFWHALADKFEAAKR